MAQANFYNLAVIDNIPFGLAGMQGHFFALRLELPDWKGWAPGQFVMIRPQSWNLEIPWARPFSICRVTKEELVIFFQVSGRGTERMAYLRSGNRVHLWGPLGNRFSIEEKPTLILAGGIGIAPFIGYIDSHPNPKNLYMMFSHKYPNDCYPIENLSEKVNFFSFQENTLQDREVFLEQVRTQVKNYAACNGLILVCGPTPFLKFVQSIALENNVRTQLSLESQMACGIGACLGCVVQTTNKWPVKNMAGMPVPTCTNGPVFWADQITL